MSKEKRGKEANFLKTFRPLSPKSMYTNKVFVIEQGIPEIANKFWRKKLANKFDCSIELYVTYTLD